MRSYLRVSPELLKWLIEYGRPRPAGVIDPPPVQCLGYPVVVDDTLPDQEWRWEMRCWQCGVAPAGYTELTVWGHSRPRVIPRWPRGGDHPHAERPPEPGEILEAANAIMARIRSNLTE